MKDMGRRLFSLAIEDSEYFNDEQDKIEMVGNCPREEKDCCKEQLSVINKCFLESSLCLRDKDYPNSIEALKSAFYKTTELQESSCIKCAELFRSTITHSLENIHDDLQKMSISLFSHKRYKSSYEMATSVLSEFKQAI